MVSSAGNSPRHSIDLPDIKTVTASSSEYRPAALVQQSLPPLQQDALDARATAAKNSALPSDLQTAPLTGLKASIVLHYLMKSKER